MISKSNLHHQLRYFIWLTLLCWRWALWSYSYLQWSYLVSLPILELLYCSFWLLEKVFDSFFSLVFWYDWALVSCIMIASSFNFVHQALGRWFCLCYSFCFLIFLFLCMKLWVILKVREFKFLKMEFDVNLLLNDYKSWFTRDWWYFVSFELFGAKICINVLMSSEFNMVVSSVQGSWESSASGPDGSIVFVDLII